MSEHTHRARSASHRLKANIKRTCEQPQKEVVPTYIPDDFGQDQANLIRWKELQQHKVQQSMLKRKHSSKHACNVHLSATNLLPLN